MDSSKAPHMTTSWPRWERRTEQTVAIAPSPRMVMHSGMRDAFDRDGPVNSIGDMSEPGISDLLTVAQAIEIIDGAEVTPRVVEMPLQEAMGMRLAEDLAADRDYPPFDKSLMDGCAVLCADLGSS